MSRASEVQLSAKTQQAALQHLCRLIERGAEGLVLRDHCVGVQAVEQIRLLLPVAAIADSKLVAAPAVGQEQATSPGTKKSQ